MSSRMTAALEPDGLIIAYLKKNLPDLMAVYAFGSQVSGSATKQSDVLLNKSATIERCVGRAREDYARDPATFSTDFTRQDAAMMNIQRACEAALDIGQYIIRRDRLGVAQSARDVFELLSKDGWIEKELSESLKRMVGFRNIAVHDYQKILLPITISIITEHLDEFLQFSACVLKYDTLQYKH